jgi:hypothetical protein
LSGGGAGISANQINGTCYVVRCLSKVVHISFL